MMMIGASGKKAVERIKKSYAADRSGARHWEQGNFYLITDGEEEGLFWEVPGKAGLVAVRGRIFSLKGRSGPVTGEDIWSFYQKEEDTFLSGLEGEFLLLLRDTAADRTLLVRDKIGVERLFYAETAAGLVFGSEPGPVADLGENGRELHNPALLKYLLFNYNPGEETFFRGVRRLRPAWLLDRTGKRILTKRYWQLDFTPDPTRSEEETAEGIRSQLRRAVEQRISAERSCGAFLSGGLDSSSVVSLLHTGGKKELHTFSFRCRGESFDESPFARKVAETFGTHHHLVEYGPGEVLLAREMTALMDEPFCDVGINIATYLLARQAAGLVDDIFTGDGGDELFAGHPVYTADKVARVIDLIPLPLLRPLFALGRRLRDSEKKKDLRVKIKRFSESFEFPRQLGTHRWRVYYRTQELSQLLSSGFLEGIRADESLFQDVIAYNLEAGDCDPLSRSLYSDYQTAVQFYLRRLDMARRLGLRPQVPMLDERIVSYCATIPARMKLPGFSDVKHVEKIAVEPLLPEEIVHRKDKLGHSIPLKNWMRDDPVVRDFFNDTLLSREMRQRGLFQSSTITEMLDEHSRSFRNHSHRLWAILVLELWLEHHFGGKK